MNIVPPHEIVLEEVRMLDAVVCFVVCVVISWLLVDGKMLVWDTSDCRVVVECGTVVEVGCVVMDWIDVGGIVDSLVRNTFMSG